MADSPEWRSSWQSTGRTLLNIFLEITFYWWIRLLDWTRQPSARTRLFTALSRAKSFEEWDEYAHQLDDHLENNFWRQDPRSKVYDFKAIEHRLLRLIDVVESEDIDHTAQFIRSGLVRNLGNITLPALFSRAWAGTKLLIEDYIAHVSFAVKYVADFETDPTGWETGLSSQAKLDVLHDARLAFGRTCLVLQGGSMFGLCHLGVVKALYLRGLLPRIILGNATGALMAALVSVHTDHELLDFLKGDSIDLSAFEGPDRHRGRDKASKHGWFKTILRRVQRAWETGFVLDLQALELCVRDNIGDVTFQEAYTHTTRILNITVPSRRGDPPRLLNYLTAPNVLIWSAAMASNTAVVDRSTSVLKCKMPDGSIEPWDMPMSSDHHHNKRTAPSHTTQRDRRTPLTRVSELFNVNHFVVSQARPYLAPFLAPTIHHSNSPRENRMSLSTFMIRLTIMELQHRLRQLDTLGWLHPAVKRLLLDESVPGPSWTLVPEVDVADFVQLLGNPTADKIDHWILRGERSVWPAVPALTVRCHVEFTLDACYQRVRTRKPFDPPHQPLLRHQPIDQNDRHDQDHESHAPPAPANHRPEESRKRKKMRRSSTTVD